MYAILTTSKIKVGLTLFTKDIHGQKGLWTHCRLESKQMEQFFFLWTNPVARINAKTDPVVPPPSHSKHDT